MADQMASLRGEVEGTLLRRQTGRLLKAFMGAIGIICREAG
jgi:hypothetical protein